MNSSGFARRRPRLQWRGRAGFTPASLLRPAIAGPGRERLSEQAGLRPRRERPDWTAASGVGPRGWAVNKSIPMPGIASKVTGLVARLPPELELPASGSGTHGSRFRVSKHEWPCASTIRTDCSRYRHQRSVRDSPESRQGRDGRGVPCLRPQHATDGCAEDRSRGLAHARRRRSIAAGTAACSFSRASERLPRARPRPEQVGAHPCDGAHRGADPSTRTSGVARPRAAIPPTNSARSRARPHPGLLPSTSRASCTVTSSLAT